MSFKPIPRRDLVHTAVLTTVISEDYGEVNESRVITLTNVRIQGMRKVNNGNDESEDKSNFLLFFDARNSKATEIVDGDEVTVSLTDIFKLQQLLRWEEGYPGIDLVVRDINPVYDRSLHHYEVKVS